MDLDLGLDIENATKLVKNFIEKRPTKDVYEKCLIELLIEKNAIMSTEDYDKNLIEKIDKVIESIQIYLKHSRTFKILKKRFKDVQEH